MIVLVTQCQSPEQISDVTTIGGFIMKGKNKTKQMTIIAMMTAISIALYFIAEIPIIPAAPNLKIDLSDIPALVAAILVNPIAGIIVEFMKNVIHVLRTGTFGLGELANFVVGVAVVVPISLIYRKWKTRSNLISYITGAVASTVSIIIFGLGINALIYPLFMQLLGNPIESTAVLVAYLGSTVIMNLVKAGVTMVPVFLLLPVLENQNIIKDL